MSTRTRLPRLPRFAAAARRHGMSHVAILAVRGLARDLVLSNPYTGGTKWTAPYLDVALTSVLHDGKERTP